MQIYLGFKCNNDLLSDSFIVEEWKFLKKEEVLQLPFAEPLWNKLSRRIEDRVIEVYFFLRKKLCLIIF